MWSRGSRLIVRDCCSREDDDDDDAWKSFRMADHNQNMAKELENVEVRRRQACSNGTVPCKSPAAPATPAAPPPAADNNHSNSQDEAAGSGKGETPPSFIRLSVCVAAVCLLSAVIHEHKDKRRYDPEKDFPYSRIAFTNGQNSALQSCHGKKCLVDGRPMTDPIWNNVTNSLDYVVGKEAGINVIKEPSWSRDRHPIFMSLVVLSAPKNTKERERVRREFVQLRAKVERQFDKRMALTFLLGAVESPEVASLLNDEHHTHGDIFQISKKDSYQVLSYKTLTTFLWHKRISAPVDWIAKFDDDVDISWDKLLPNFVDAQKSSNSTAHPARVFCHLILRNRPTFRPENSLDPYHKLNVDADSYSPEVQPPYCNGWIYILSPETGRQLALASQVTPFVHIEDLFVTGILRERLGYELTSVGKVIPFFDDGRLNCPMFSIWRAEYLESFATPRDEWPWVTFQRTFAFATNFVNYIFPIF